MDPTDPLLTVENLLSSNGVSTLGLVASKMLLNHYTVCFQVNAEGTVEVVPILELQLDALPENEALDLLVGRGYSDPQLFNFLHSRAHRLNKLNSPTDPSILPEPQLNPIID